MATHAARTADRRLARTLGWLGVGTGVGALAAPRALATLVGAPDRFSLLRALGARELASGLGILAQRRPKSGWLWARVAGDAMDLALLGTALRVSDGERRSRLVATTAAVAGVAALDVYCSRRLSMRGNGARRLDEKSVIVGRPPEELYRSWRDVRQLSRFLRDVASHDVEIVEERPHERIAWRVRNGAAGLSGAVRFERAPGNRGTRVAIEVAYATRAAAAGALVGRLFGHEPGQRAQEALRRFKQLVETGEIATTQGQPAGGPRR